MKAIFGFPNLLRKKIILQILVTEKRVFGAQYGDTGIIKASFLLFFFFKSIFTSIPILKSARIKRTKKPGDNVHKKWWFDMKKLFFN